MRIQPVFLCCFDQTEDHRAALSAPRRIGKQEVLSGHDKRLYAAFGTVVAELEPSVQQIMIQFCPLVSKIGKPSRNLLRRNSGFNSYRGQGSKASGERLADILEGFNSYRGQGRYDVFYTTGTLSSLSCFHHYTAATKNT